MVAEYVEHLWEEGAPKSAANYVVAAIQFYRPECKHHLAWSWKLVKVWNQLEVPQRATPLSPELLMAFAGQVFRWQQFELGWLLVVGFTVPANRRIAADQSSGCGHRRQSWGFIHAPIKRR